MRVSVLILLLAAVLFTGCATGLAVAPEPSPVVPVSTAEAPVSTASTPAPTTDTRNTDAPTSPPVPDIRLEDLSVGIRLFAEGFTQPTHVTNAGDDSGRLFVTEQAGRIWVVRDGTRLEDPFLDIEPLVGSNANEQGLLSIAFHPRFLENGQFFVNYTDREGTTVVARYSVATENPDRADPDSATVLLTIEQPAANHNGGLLKFGPDGYLYIGTGDGGRAGDPWGNGQSLDTLLGKLLRIDVDGGEPYAVPPNNPFNGNNDARPEIWAYGLRNPWRFAFDRVTGDLYVADVGQNEQEEVHFQPAGSMGGENYGWDIMEGTACFEARSCDQDGLLLPVATYDHGSDEGGCSITGGYVYRGKAFPELAGVYLYADYCTGNLWGLRLPFAAGDHALIATLDIRATSFGEDERGELYLADREGGGIYRIVLVDGA
jgi:glucose/arabinose dehydrogenase